MRRAAPPPTRRRGNLTHDLGGNGARVPGTLVTPREYVDAMQAYDRLPRRIRQALRRAPFNVDPVGALQYVQNFGEERALEVLRDSLGVGLTKSYRETGLRTGICRD